MVSEALIEDHGCWCDALTLVNGVRVPIMHSSGVVSAHEQSTSQ